MWDSSSREERRREDRITTARTVYTYIYIYTATLVIDDMYMRAWAFPACWELGSSVGGETEYIHELILVNKKRHTERASERFNE